MSDAVENAKLLAKSYKANSREELTHVYDQWASSYDIHAIERNSAQPGAVAKMCVELIDNRNAFILDVGAGTGLIGEDLKSAGFGNLVALDPSAKMLDLARSKAAYQSFYQEYLGDRLSFESDIFDVIVASGIFTVGHVNAAVFPELNRILKFAGKMIFSINTKMLNDVDFCQLLEKSGSLNWVVEQISPEFDMMDNQYSTATAVVVVLRKAD